MQENQSKQTVLITGCSTGFGKLSALTFARDSYTVFATMRQSKAKNLSHATELQDLAAQENLDLHILELDVNSDSSVENGVTRVIQQSGKIDILINNAGIMYLGDVTEGYTIEQARNQFEPNFFGVLRMNKAVLPHMREQRSGLIIAISSLAGGLLFPLGGLYCASKMALEAISLSYRYDLAQFGIDSIVVEPGPFATNLLNSNVPAQDTPTVDAYGPEMVEVSQQFIRDIEKGQLDPEIVVDAMLNVAKKPFGTRPFRTIPGPDFGLLLVNEAKAVAQNELIEALNLNFMNQSFSKLTQNTN